MQLETIAQFGIFLILFVLGLEFSVAHLQGTWREALQSALGQMTLILGAVVFGSRILPITPSEVRRMEMGIGDTEGGGARGLTPFSRCFLP